MSHEKKSIKIALINAQTDVSDMRELYIHHENLGLGLIAANLRKNGYITDLIDLRVQKISEKEIANLLANTGYDLVGMSINYATMPSAIKIVQYLTGLPEKRPFIVLGGEHTTYSDHETLKFYRNVDGIIRGEGEATFVDLATALENKKPLSEVEGLTYKDDDKIIQNKNRTPVHEIDKLPFASRDIAKQAINADIPIEIGILAQRGCPFPCSFCNAQRFLGNEVMVLRSRTAQNVVDEMEELLPLFENSYNLLRFYDATFVTKSKSSRKWIDEFCNEIEKRNLKIAFDTFIRTDSFHFHKEEDQQLLLRLRNIGMVSTYLGLEAGDDEQLSLYNKKIVSATSEQAYGILKKYGMSGSTNGFILFHQTVTMDQIKNSLNFLHRIGLATVWNLSSRGETLPGIKLNNETDMFPRKTLWDVANYHFIDSHVERLYNFLTWMKENYQFIRQEDNICRKIRDSIRVENYYNDIFGYTNKEILLDNEMKKIQQNTVNFIQAIINKITENDKWNIHDDLEIILNYVHQMEIDINDLSLKFTLSHT